MHRWQKAVQEIVSDRRLLFREANGDRALRADRHQDEELWERARNRKRWLLLAPHGAFLITLFALPNACTQTPSCGEKPTFWGVWHSPMLDI